MKLLLRSLGVAVLFVVEAIAHCLIVDEAGQVLHDLDGIFALDRAEGYLREVVKNLILRVVHECVNSMIVGFQSSEKGFTPLGMID